MMSVSRQAFDDKTARKQRGRSFKLGQSGNPGGRPRGARNKTTLAIEALLDGEAETITRKAIELAKAGDMSALPFRGGPSRKSNGRSPLGSSPPSPNVRSCSSGKPGRPGLLQRRPAQRQEAAGPLGARP